MLPEKWSIKGTPEGRGALKKAMEQLLTPEKFHSYLNTYDNNPHWTIFCYPNFKNSRGYYAGNHTGEQEGWDEITPDDLLAGLEPKEPTVINNYSIF